MNSNLINSLKAVISLLRSDKIELRNRLEETETELSTYTTQCDEYIRKAESEIFDLKESFTDIEIENIYLKKELEAARGEIQLGSMELSCKEVKRLLRVINMGCVEHKAEYTYLMGKLLELEAEEDE